MWGGFDPFISFHNTSGVIQMALPVLLVNGWFFLDELMLFSSWQIFCLSSSFLEK